MHKHGQGLIEHIVYRIRPMPRARRHGSSAISLGRIECWVVSLSLAAALAVGYTFGTLASIEQQDIRGGCARS